MSSYVFRFEDDEGNSYYGGSLMRLIEKVEHCAKCPYAPFVFTKNPNKYLLFPEFKRLMLEDKIRAKLELREEE